MTEWTTHPPTYLLLLLLPSWSGRGQGLLLPPRQPPAAAAAARLMPAASTALAGCHCHTHCPQVVPARGRASRPGRKRRSPRWAGAGAPARAGSRGRRRSPRRPPGRTAASAAGCCCCCCCGYCCCSWLLVWVDSPRRPYVLPSRIASAGCSAGTTTTPQQARPPCARVCRKRSGSIDALLGVEGALAPPEACRSAGHLSHTHATTSIVPPSSSSALESSPLGFWAGGGRVEARASVRYTRAH